MMKRIPPLLYLAVVPVVVLLGTVFLSTRNRSAQDLITVTSIPTTQITFSPESPTSEATQTISPSQTAQPTHTPTITRTPTLTLTSEPGYILVHKDEVFSLSPSVQALGELAKEKYTA